jgi:uncharacterized membrane protein YjgN (DUF898 family)
VTAPTIQPLAQAATASADTAGAARALPLRFTGSASEYFRIWIVNVCLTLLTFGIFSAWAKVRKKRYFYSHTQLDGTPFQYLGQPIPILKGRIVAALLLGMWYVGTHYVIELLPVVLIVAAVLAPWVAVRSAAFNARYSAFRNMTFRFSGSYWHAAKVIYGWLVLTVVSFGVAFSWWQQRIKRFMVTHMGYGGVHGEFAATGGQFFKTYFIAGLLMAAGAGALMGTLGKFVFAGVGKSTALIALTVVSYALYVAFYAYIRARVINLVWNNTRLGPLQFRSTLGARALLWLYVSNAVAILGSAGLLIPWATVRMLKYRVEHFAVAADGDLHEFQGSSESAVQAAGAEVGEFFDFDMSV